jgi:hypothetical protein
MNGICPSTYSVSLSFSISFYDCVSEQNVQSQILRCMNDEFKYFVSQGLIEVVSRHMSGDTEENYG